jgi:hypothetical protein
MFGIWYIVLTFTVGIQTSDVRKSVEAERIIILLN